MTGTRNRRGSEPAPPPGDRESRPHPKAGLEPPGLRSPAARTSDVRETLSTGTRRAEAQTGERRRPLEAPTPDRVLETVLALSRQVSVEMHDEEIVEAYVTALTELLPMRRFAVRLLAPDSGRLTLAHATGRLLPERRSRTEVTREALERHRLEEPTSIAVTDVWVPLFEEGSVGFDVPTVDGNRIQGILGVEYPPGVEEPPGDRHIVVSVAIQLGAALRNARLLRESRYLRDYLGKLLDHANAPIVVIGRHREIRVVNRAFLALTGMSRDSVLGLEFTSLLPEEDRARLLPVFITALRGEPTTNFELRIPRRKGGYARVVMNTASILSATGDVEAVIAIGRDLTEVRELEEQIIQAEKLATLGQLAAGVVHELNNPLTSISVYSDYLLKRLEHSDTDESHLEKLRRIVQSADRILRFTRDLVTYARPATDAPKLVSLHDALDQSVVFCEHVIEETGVTIERAYAQMLPPVYAVETQLHQVFINLITNACHAMPEGAGRLKLETSREGNDHVRVMVSDNGVGIPESQRDAVFEPFFSTKGEGKGTGLGLSIVRNIVQQHNASIEVRSQVGDGSTFEIVFPCRPRRRSEPP